MAGSAAAVVARLEALASQWTKILLGLDDAGLDRPLSYSMARRAAAACRRTAAWANSEMMNKNVGRNRIRTASVRGAEGLAA